MLKLVLGGKDRSLAGHDLLFQLQKLLRPFLIWRGFFIYESHTSIFLSSGIGLFQYPASRQPAASFAGGCFSGFRKLRNLRILTGLTSGAVRRVPEHYKGQW